MRAADPTGTATALRQPSLRRRLLAYVLLPALLFTIGATALLYVVALHYSNKVHDRDLTYSVLGLADALEDGPSNGGPAPRAAAVPRRRGFRRPGAVPAPAGDPWRREASS